MNKTLSHIGTKRHSGRYPWGSGDNPEERNKSFLGTVSELKKKGLSEVDIAKGVGMNTKQLRDKKSIRKAEDRAELYSKCLKLKNKGYSYVEIGKQVGKNESSVRAILDPVLKARSEVTSVIANMLKDAVDKKQYIDVGLGVEHHIGVSRSKLKVAISMLEEEGYRLHDIPVRQLGTGKMTEVLTLAGPGVLYREVWLNRDKIRLITDHSEDGGRSFFGIEPVNSIDSKRIQIQYFEDGGKDKDGVIELRRGVSDLSLGSKSYAQVRIGVDGTHYLKGMAMYADKLPNGIDVIYNTNKHIGTPKEQVFKSMEKDKNGNITYDDPFGTSIMQKHYLDANGKEQLSALNRVGAKEGAGEEGSWETWSRTLSSQILSKQPPSLAKKQLGLSYNVKKEEFDEIMSLTNPVIKKHLLAKFADDADSAAVHLKAAALPGQMSHVLLPVPSMKETEVYAPNYITGERVVLIRHPHGGIFEIPELIVNNNRPIPRKLFKEGLEDAIGINPKVAEKLSGADFDGDAVLVIPNNNRLIKSSSPLKDLIGFDPKESYPEVLGMKIMGTKGGGTTGQKMGDITNLITDMQIKKADTDEVARAVRHSMVVIDAEKHKLNYAKSYIDNGIAGLKKRYQGGANRGASTLISRAKSDFRVDPFKVVTNIKKMTSAELEAYKSGKKIYEYTPESYTNKKGKIVNKKIKSTKMAETDDAFTLSSGTPIEAIYATHANKLKVLGNIARKEVLNTPHMFSNPSAKETYKNEVASLKAHLNIALKNAPLERQAQLLANANVATKKADNPNMDDDDLKKIKNRAQAEARMRLGAKKQRIDITDKEWEAIQAGAISTSALSQILNNTDLKKIKQLATPRIHSVMTSAKTATAKARLASGYTQAEVAASLGVSVATLKKAIS